MNNNVMLSVPDLIKQLKDKGVLFSIVNEESAIEHLKAHNNYFKLTAYRKNYSKKTSGKDQGKYEKLEFAYLVELARLDTGIRQIILQMTLDIEHFFKVALITAVENNLGKGEDGYKILQGYLSADDITYDPLKPDEIEAVSFKRKTSFDDVVKKSCNNPYCNGLANKFKKNMPIWAYVEICTFGDLIGVARYYETKKMWTPPIDIRALDRVRQLRNACAHGNCIINDLNCSGLVNANKSSSPVFITKFLHKAKISPDQRKKKMSNIRINQIVFVLFIYDELISSGNTRTLRLRQLHDLIDIRMRSNSEFFSENPVLCTTYDFFKKIVDIMS